MKYLVVDLKKCVGCYNCQITCKDEHVGNEWLPYTKPQSEGQYWIKVRETERGSIPKVKVDWLPIICMHCHDAPCMISCRVKGAIYKREDGIVIIDPIKCTGCKDCMKSCPYQAIYFNDSLKIAQKCTMCAHLLDDGWKQPRCTSSCPTEAIGYYDSQNLVGHGEILTIEEKHKVINETQVTYIGLNQKFIAGEVYCPQENKCLEGAQVTLTNTISGEKFVSKTNNYGDFWLEDLDTSIYYILIEKEGYYPKELHNINMRNDLNLGEIKLFKKN